MSYQNATRSALLVALALAVGAAQASAISANVSISGLQLQLTDLTPGDGHAPSLTFTRDISAPNASTLIELSNQLVYQQGGGSFNWPLLAANSTLAGGVAKAAFTTQKGYFLDSAVQASTPTIDTDKYSFATATTYYYADFQLAAHSAVTVSGHFAANALLSSPVPHIMSSIEVAGGVGFGPGQPDFAFYSRLSDSDITPFSLSQDFSFTYYNNSADPVGLTFGSSNYVTLTNYPGDPVIPPTPVPEPASYAMLSVGALLLGAFARRRQSRA